MSNTTAKATLATHLATTFPEMKDFIDNDLDAIFVDKNADQIVITPKDIIKDKLNIQQRGNEEIFEKNLSALTSLLRLEGFEEDGGSMNKMIIGIKHD